MRVEQVLIYPIKSLPAIDVSNGWPYERYGLRYDHWWMVVDETGRFVSQRTHPKMALLEQRFASLREEDDFLFVRQPSGAGFLISSFGMEGECRAVSVHDDYGIEAVDQGDRAGDFFSNFLGVPGLRLVRIADDSDRRTSTGARIAFQDGSQILVISTPSINDFNIRARLAVPATAASFRPQLLLEDCEPYAEDHLLGIDAGELRLEGGTLCVRCAMPDVIPQTGDRRPGRPVTRALEVYRQGRKPGKDKNGVFFGRNMTIASVSGSRIVKAGDEVAIISEDAGLAMYQ